MIKGERRSGRESQWLIFRVKSQEKIKRRICNNIAYKIIQKIFILNSKQFNYIVR